MRFITTSIIVLCSSCAGCVSVRPVSKVHAFDSLESAYDFMLFRNLITSSDANREIARQSSRVSKEVVSGKEFSIVTFDFIRPGKTMGVRGQNGPMYILLRNADAYSLVGEFHGSLVTLSAKGDEIVASVYYHYSAFETPHIDYPFRNGRFNYIEPSARGDGVWK